MGNPKITIVTVSFNAEDVISKTMLSVLGQSYDNIEYILMDGGSKDGTLKIAKEIAGKYPSRDIKIFSKSDKGIYDAMNNAILIAKGDWLNFMNSGDVFYDNNVVSNIVKSGLMNKFAFIYSDFIVSIKGKRHYINQSFEKGRVLHQSLFYKKALHDRYGLYLVTHPYIVSDYLFFIQVDKSFVAKYNNPISINDGDGISMSGNWAPVEKECVDFMFRKCNAWCLVFRLIKTIIKQRILKIIR